nr:hemagglutinin repeat-containing protein [Veillonella caviae]
MEHVRLRLYWPKKESLFHDVELVILCVNLVWFQNIRRNTINHITRGKDTNLIGSTATGASVKANVGGNVTIESLQDTNSYDETSRHTGISVSTADMTHFGVSGANVKGHIDSDYKSVTQQAGIHAGAKGIDITVGDTTTLKGAIITSTATPGNNKLSTK